MRRFAVLAAVVVALAAPLPAFGQGKPIVAIMGVEDRTGQFGRLELEEARARLESAVQTQSKYAVLTDPEKEADRVQFRSSYGKECVGQECWLEAGRAIGVNSMISCSLSKVGSQCVLTCHLADVDTSVMLSAVSASTACNKSGFSDALHDIGGQLARKLDPRMTDRAVRSDAKAGTKSTAAAEPAAILAVMEIDDKTGRFSTGELEAASQHLRTGLAESQRFRVVPKSRQEDALVRELRKKSYEDCYSEKCQIELGQQLAADTLVRPTITELGGVCTLSAVLLDLASATSTGGRQADFDCNGKGLKAGVKSVVEGIVAEDSPTVLAKYSPADTLPVEEKPALVEPEPAGVTKVVVAAPEPVQVEQSGWPLRYWGWTAVGVGMLSCGVSAIFYFQAMDKAEEANNLPVDERNGLLSDAQTMWFGMMGTAGAGVLLVGGGVFMIFMDDSDEPKGGATQVSLTPVISEQALGFAVTGRF